MKEEEGAQELLRLGQAAVVEGEEEEEKGSLTKVSSLLLRKGLVFIHKCEKPRGSAMS